MDRFRWTLLLVVPWLVIPIGAAESVEAGPDRPPLTSDFDPSPDFYFHHGTLAVVLMEPDQIVIAIDSRATANRVGRANSVEDGVEKVLSLSPHVAFFFTGAGLFASRSVTNALGDIAKSVAAGWRQSQRRIQLEPFAHDFEARVAKDLSRLTLGDIHHLHLTGLKTGSSNVFQAYLAGQDADAAFKVFRVSCFTLVATNGNRFDARLAFDVSEQKREGRQWLLFLGAANIFGEGMSNPEAPLAPLMKQLKTGRGLLAEPTAAALLAAGVREYGDGPQSLVGYPLFVYAIDTNGFRLTRKIQKAERVTFDPADQDRGSTNAPAK